MPPASDETLLTQKTTTDMNDFADSSFRPAFYTLQIVENTSPEASSSKAPIWYFDLKEEFDQAVELSAQLGLAVATGHAVAVPESDFVTAFMEYEEYAWEQLPADNLPTMH